MECPQRNEHLFMKGISREEEIEMERQKRKKKERWVGQQQHIGDSNQRERWEQELHSQRGNAVPGHAYTTRLEDIRLGFHSILRHKLSPTWPWQGMSALNICKIMSPSPMVLSKFQISIKYFRSQPCLHFTRTLGDVLSRTNYFMPYLEAGNSTH